MTTWKINPMGALCYLEIDCHINGVQIEEEDFVDKYDHDREHAPDYGCGDMYAEELEKIPEGVLEKYHITEEEWHLAAYEIARAVSFGNCAWCS